MGSLGENLKEKLLEKYGDRLDEELESIIKEYSELINKDAALHILAYRNDLLKREIITTENFEDIKSTNCRYNIKAKIRRKFAKMKLKNYEIQRVLIEDKYGNHKMLVLWNEQIKKIENFDIDNWININLCYSKNEDEIQLTRRGDIQPNISDKITKIRELRDNNRYNILCKIVSDPQIKTYVKDNTENKMIKFEVADESGRVPLIGWKGDIVNILEGANKGDDLYLENATFRNGEIHLIPRFTKIKLNPQHKIILRLDELLYSNLNAWIEGIIEKIELKDGKIVGIVQADRKEIKAIFSENIFEKEFEDKIPKDMNIKTPTLLKIKNKLKQRTELKGKIENGILWVEEIS